MPADPTTLTVIAPLAAASQANAEPHEAEQQVVALFDQFRDRLLRYLLCFGLTVPDSEEVIQEVFLSLFQHLQNGRPRNNLRGWIFRVAHNLALKRRGRNRRNLETPVEAGAEYLAVDPAPDPEEQLVHSQSQRHLMAAFLALPERDRRCLALRAESLRYREIARILDMSLGAVSLSLARSLARLARSSER